MNASVLLLAIASINIALCEGAGYIARPYYNNHRSRNFFIHRKCERLEAPENGRIRQTGIAPGSRALYSCNAGFTLTGNRIRVCQVNGAFSGVAPTCEPVDCGQPDNLQNGNTILVDGTTTVSSRVRFVCNIGFNLVGSNSAICQADGTYSARTPVCILVDCGQPDALQNGEIILLDETTTFLSRVEFVCDINFNLVGSNSAVCQADGTYSSETPECVPVDCGDPDPADPNGSRVVEGTSVGSITTYFCPPEFELLGSPIAICTSDGVWSDPAPRCILIDCGPLPDLSNGNVATAPGTTVGSVATYSCRQGFRLVGGNQRTCQTSGQWSGTQPSCRRVRCPRLSSPRFARLYYSGYYPGDYVTYQCSHGYEARGGRGRRVCQHTGVWSGSDIICQRKSYYGGYGPRNGHNINGHY